MILRYLCTDWQLLLRTLAGGSPNTGWQPGPYLRLPDFHQHFTGLLPHRRVGRLAAVFRVEFFALESGGAPLRFSVAIISDGAAACQTYQTGARFLDQGIPHPTGPVASEVDLHSVSS